MNFNQFWWTCQCCTDNLTLVFFKLACTKISQKKRTRKGKRKDSSSRRESGNEFSQHGHYIFTQGEKEGYYSLHSYINVYCIYRWYILVMKGKSFSKPTLTYLDLIQVQSYSSIWWLNNIDSFGRDNMIGECKGHSIMEHVLHCSQCSCINLINLCLNWI